MNDTRIEETFQDSSKNNITDGFTKKQLRADVLKIAWPALAELFLIQLCSMVDTMMVGRLGPYALASVGYCTQPKFLLLSMFVALNTGNTALVAHAKGQGNKELASLAMQQCFFVSICLSIIVSIFGFVFSQDMVVFMGANDAQTISAATSYMQIQMIGFIFNAITMVTTASLRGIGKTKSSLVYNISSNIVNVVLNFLLINGIWIFPRLEVAGASIATVIGQIVAFVMAMFIINRDDYLHFDIKKLFNIDISMLKRILRIGSPAMGEQIVMRFGMMIYTLTITSLGATMYAVHQIVASILTMSFMNGQAFGIAATSLLGQSMGRNKIDEASAYTLECRRIAMIVSIVLALIFFFFGRPLAFLYSDDPYVIDEAVKIMMVVAFLQPLQSSQLVISGALRGAGDTKIVAIITFVGIILVRPLLSFIAIEFFHLGLMGAWLAMTIDQGCRSLISYLRFKSKKWMYIKV